MKPEKVYVCQWFDKDESQYHHYRIQYKKENSEYKYVIESIVGDYDKDSIWKVMPGGKSLDEAIHTVSKDLWRKERNLGLYKGGAIPNINYWEIVNVPYNTVFIIGSPTKYNKSYKDSPLGDDGIIFEYLVK